MIEVVGVLINASSVIQSLASSAFGSEGHSKSIVQGCY